MEKGVAEFIGLFYKQHDGIMQDVTTRVSNGLVATSVVDTGELVADWDVAVGSWPADTTQPLDPSRRTTRARLKTGFKDVRFGQSVFFENTDPAAIAQEFGGWRSAPNGLSRLVVRRFPGYVKGAARAAQNRIKKGMVFD